MLWLDGMDHSLVRDPQRQVVFDAIDSFVVGHAPAAGQKAAEEVIGGEHDGGR
jgi:hypothetical protein